MRNKTDEICYLCNKPIDPKATDELTRRSEDHIPAMVIHPKALRPNLKKTCLKPLLIKGAIPNTKVMKNILLG